MIEREQEREREREEWILVGGGDWRGT